MSALSQSGTPSPRNDSDRSDLHFSNQSESPAQRPVEDAPDRTEAKRSQELLDVLRAANDPRARARSLELIDENDSTACSCVHKLVSRLEESAGSRVCDIARCAHRDSKRVRVKGVDKVLVIADGAVMVDVRERLPEMEMVDGEYHLVAKRLELRPIAPDDLGDLNIESEADLVERLSPLCENETSSLVRKTGQGSIILQPTGFGPEDGLTLEEIPHGVRFSFSVLPLAEESSGALLKKNAFWLHEMGSLAVARMVRLAEKFRAASTDDPISAMEAVDVERTVRFKLNLAIEELFPNMLGHNVLGIRLLQLSASEEAFRDVLAEIRSGTRGGRVGFELALDGQALVIRAFQPHAFRFGSDDSLSEEDAFKLWWDSAEQASEDDHLEIITGRGALLLKGLLKLNPSIDPGTHMMTFRVDLGTWLAPDE